MENKGENRNKKESENISEKENEKENEMESEKKSEKENERESENISEKENERESEKRNKKESKKIKVIGIISIIVILGVISAVIFLTSNKEDDATQKLESNQELVYGKITEINGNEITYTVYTLNDGIEETINEVVETTEVDLENSETEIEATIGERPGRDALSTDQVSEEEASGDTSEGDMPSGERPNRDVLSGDEVSGDMPSGDMLSGEEGIGDMSGGDRPSEEEGIGDMSGGDMPGGDMPSEEEIDATEENQNGSSTASSTSTYIETEESVTLLIPVGTSVTTKLGTVTTFSRLAAGDLIAMVVEKQSDGSFVIISIEIVE